MSTYISVFLGRCNTTVVSLLKITKDLLEDSLQYVCTNFALDRFWDRYPSSFCLLKITDSFLFSPSNATEEIQFSE